MTNDRPLIGISLMLGFCFLAPLGDAMAKYLGNSIPLLELLFVRFIMQLVLLLPIIMITTTKIQLSWPIFNLIVVRTTMHILGIGAMFVSYRYLPLADAVAIAFVMPFVMLILGNVFLGEEVGMRRILACIVGFVGTLFVIQPSFANVGYPALYPVLVAIVFALYMLFTRKVAHSIDPISLQAISGFIAIIILTVFYLFTRGSDNPDLQIIMPENKEIWILLGIGTLGTFAHLLMSWALKFAPSATLAPMQYLEIPIATLIGFLVFGDFPNTLATIGILITISAGIYIILRESALSRARNKLNEAT